MKYYRDLKNSLDTAKEEERAFEIVKELLKNGGNIEIIVQTTGLTKDKIELIKRKEGLLLNSTMYATSCVRIDSGSGEERCSFISGQ